ncbi:MAG: sigma 54-interacting transcriptional regulator [Thermodesulfobacteriota bacterium]|nr:sigma 54-interacting transcriptional regulator [Thermodesulfobacteriota bacterium]
MISQKNPCFTGNNISSGQWLLLLDQLNIGAFTIDLMRRITSFNQSARALLGLEDAEVIGRDCRKVFRGVPCRLKCPFQTGWEPEPKDLEVEVLDASDKKRPVTRLSAPLYDQDRNLAGCLTILQDCSPLADLIDRVSYGEKSLKIILDNLDVAIFGVNRGGYITFFNTAAETITGYNRRQVLGKSCRFILGPGDDQGLALLKKSMTDGRPRETEKTKINSREGETIDVKADYMPLTNDQGKIIGGLVTLHDLTLAQQLDQVITNHYTFHNMIGKDPAMRKIFEMAGMVADSEATVLIEGATGTGKDLLAKVIHSASSRSDRLMVKVNCAALPDNLLESEIFGYVKGAFTGADHDKPGRFQEADGGTILLDEIGDLPLSLQAKLLGVLEDKEFYPLGGRHNVKVDVRIIAATLVQARKRVVV